MPVIIPEKDYDRWLQPADPDRPPIDLLRPCDADKMTAWKVDKAFGNPQDRSSASNASSSTFAEASMSHTYTTTRQPTKMQMEIRRLQLREIENKALGDP
jgi:hypothetical protein